MKENMRLANDELVFKPQNLIGSTTIINTTCIRKRWGLGPGINITLSTELYHAHHTYIQPN